MAYHVALHISKISTNFEFCQSVLSEGHEVVIPIANTSIEW